MQVSQHLQHFLSSLLGSKEFWAALVGALTGGLLTGWFSLLAQKQAGKDQRRASEEVERRSLTGILQAIASELKVLRSNSLLPLQKRLEELTKRREKLWQFNPDAFLPFAMTPSEQNYFVVFDSNAAALGRINDEILREHMIKVYGHAKALVDSLNFSSRNFERWRLLKHLPENHPEKQTVIAILEGLETGIRIGLSNLELDLDTLLNRIDDFLAT